MSEQVFPLRVRELTYREADASYDVGLHTHKYYQLYCLLRGDVSMHIDGHDYPMQAGQLAIVKPGARRGPHCTGRAPRYMIALFSTTNLQVDDICHRVLELSEAQQQQIDALLGDLEEPDLGNAMDYRVSVLCQLLIDLRRRLRAGKSQNQLPRLNYNARNEVVTQAEAFMRAHLHQSIKRKHIADAVHFSAPHLARLFKAVLGMTINQRLTEMRLDHARRLLLQSSYPITQIAGEVGFQSFSHFAKLFQQAVGMTPSEYRAGRGRRLTVK